MCTSTCVVLGGGERRSRVEMAEGLDEGVK
jgi:hypothetical protein